MPGPSKAEIEECFKEFDADGSGFIENKEVAAICEKLGMKATKEEVDALIKEADTSKDGKISLAEFTKVLSA